MTCVLFLFYFIFINLFILFIYFWLRWVFVAVCGLSLVAASGGYSSLRCMGFSLCWLLLLWSTGSRHTGFSSCGTRAQQLWCRGLVAPRHVGSSWTTARTCIPCIGRWILYHCTTREVPWLSLETKIGKKFPKASRGLNFTCHTCDLYKKKVGDMDRELERTMSFWQKEIFL